MFLLNGELSALLLWDYYDDLLVHCHLKHYFFSQVLYSCSCSRLVFPPQSCMIFNGLNQCF